MLMDVEDIEAEHMVNNTGLSTTTAVARPTTPHNERNVSLDTFTPPNANNHSDSDNEHSFIRRLKWDFVNGETSTSTPIYRIPQRHYYSLPNPKTQSSISDESSKFETDPEFILYKYINPFTPDGKLLLNKTKTQQRLKNLSINISPTSASTNSADSKENETIDFVSGVPTRYRLNELNVSRFNEEFVELEKIGKGDHGSVFKCVNRINGCIYAIKKTIRPVKSGFEERIIQNEIYAHGVLEHNNIVRNFSCWKEEGNVFIQNEYCNGGNLEEYVKRYVMTESQLYSLVLQMCYALKFIHSMGLAHMDIKPGNIFLCLENKGGNNNDERMDGLENKGIEDGIVFKLGDLGHVAKIDETHYVDEGDCRYYPRELLEDKLDHLDRADIFSLGLTVYEAAGGGPLPNNGEKWHELRNGNLKYLPQHTKRFNDILTHMINPDPEKRPSVADLIETVQPLLPSPLEEMFGHLKRYKNDSSSLEHQAEASDQCLKLVLKTHKHIQQQMYGKDKFGKDKLLGISKKTGSVMKTRIVGRRTGRSRSNSF